VPELTSFRPGSPAELSDTKALILASGLRIHDSVDRITVHGSRGPKGGARANSDLDLCLIVNTQAISAASDREGLLREVVLTTLNSWNGPVKLDVAAIFDRSGCDLQCLSLRGFNPNLCVTTVDCMGIFKVPGGYVSGPAVDCSLVYPFAEIWSRFGKSQ